jgi:transcriptional regulator with XRE-family HTH domain
MVPDDIDPKSLVNLGQAVRKKRKALGWTQQNLASESGHNEKDIRKLERGEVIKFQTLNNICQALEISIDQHLSRRSSEITVADEKYGAYNRSHYDGYIGPYFAYRRSLTVPENFIRTIFEIAWSNDRRCFIFAETHRYMTSNGESVDFSQSGDIYINNNMGLLHLITSAEGAIRLITLSKLRTNNNLLAGIVLTQLRSTLYYSPAVSPIYLQKIDGVTDIGEMLDMVGPISPIDEAYTPVAMRISEIEEEVAYFPPAIASLDRKITRMIPRVTNSR